MFKSAHCSVYLLCSQEREKRKLHSSLFFLFLQQDHSSKGCASEKQMMDFPGGPVGKTVLPLQGTQVQSLVGELRVGEKGTSPLA